MSSWIALVLPFGRMNRLWFCVTYLFYGAVLSTSTRLLAAYGETVKQPSLYAFDWSSSAVAMPMAVLAITLWLSFVAIVNRLHDIDLGGIQLLSVALILMVPSALSNFSDLEEGVRNLIGIACAVIAGLFTLYILLKCVFARGDEEANRFGPIPNNIPG